MGRVVAIGATDRQAGYALSELVEQGVVNLGGLAPVPEAPGQRLGQPQVAIASRQQDDPAVAAERFAGKADVNGLGKKVWKQNRLSCRMIHGKALSLVC